MIAATPEPPYYAVIFSSLRSQQKKKNQEGNHGHEDDADYAATAHRMVTLAAQQPGFLGIESARNNDAGSSLGITVSYWADLDSI